MSGNHHPLSRLRDSPNLAGGMLAILALIASMLIIPMLDKDERVTPEQRLGLSAAFAAFAFYKGRRAVQKRLGSE